MQAAGADLFYEVVHKHWGHLLPPLDGQKPPIPCLTVDDGPDDLRTLKHEKDGVGLVATKKEPGLRKRTNVEIVEIEDSEDENEAEEWEKLQDSMELSEIEDRIAYLKRLVFHLLNVLWC